MGDSEMFEEFGTGALAEEKRTRSKDSTNGLTKCISYGAVVEDDVYNNIEGIRSETEMYSVVFQCCSIQYNLHLCSIIMCWIAILKTGIK